MLRLFTALTVRLRNDRGEVGPIGYAILVSGVVLLAIAVAAWGRQIADTYLNIDYGSPGGGGD